VITPSDLLARELRRDGARPFITYYDLTTGGRVELSVATTANWVAKSAGYLADELGVEPGDTVSFDPQLHWATAILLLSAWGVGATVDFAPGAERTDVPLDPMGAGMSALVASYPDVFVPSQPSGTETLAAHSAVPEGARVLTVLPLDAAGVGWSLLAPLAAGGSVVYGGVESAAAERVTHTAGVDVPGLPRLD
jgi:hypothetical protein